MLLDYLLGGSRLTWGTLAMGGHLQKSDTVVWGWGSPVGGHLALPIQVAGKAQESKLCYRVE